MLDDDGKPCGGKHKALGCCRYHYNKLKRKRCWCGRQARRNGLCDGHLMRSEGLVPNVEIGKAPRRRPREAVAV